MFPGQLPKLVFSSNFDKFQFPALRVFKPLKRKTEPSMNLVSTLAYSSVLLSFALIAFMENLSVIATMGFFLAILIPAIYLLLYSSKFKRDLKAKVGK